MMMMLLLVLPESTRKITSYCFYGHRDKLADFSGVSRPLRRHLFAFSDTVINQIKERNRRPMFHKTAQQLPDDCKPQRCWNCTVVAVVVVVIDALVSNYGARSSQTAESNVGRVPGG